MYRIEEINMKVKEFIDCVTNDISGNSEELHEPAAYDKEIENEEASLFNADKISKNSSFEKLRQGLIRLLLSEKTVKEILCDDSMKTKMLNVSYLDTDIPADYYKIMLSVLLFQNKNTVSDYKKNYMDKNKGFDLYLKDRIFKMLDIDILAREWAVSLDTTPNDSRARKERLILKEKICDKLFDDMAITQEHEGSPYIICKYFGYMSVDGSLYTDTLLTILNEGHTSRYRIEKNSSFSMYFRSLLRKRAGTAAYNNNNVKKIFGLTGRAPNKREKKLIQGISLDEKITEDRDSFLIDRYCKDDIGMEDKVIGSLSVLDTMKEIVDMLGKIMAFRDSAANEKRRKVYYSSFTFEVIKNTEKEKINGEINERGTSTEIFLLKSQEFIKFILISFVMMLKGGEEKDYPDMYEVIRRDMIRKNVDFNKRGARSSLIFEHLLQEIGSESTIRNYIKEYDDLIALI